MSYPRDWDLDEFLRSLRHERDVRNDLDDPRRREFKTGWARAARGQALTQSTLKSLTWHNLGHRAGKYFPNASDSDIEAVLDELELRFLRPK